jgi:hypothetical protein
MVARSTPDAALGATGGGGIDARSPAQAWASPSDRLPAPIYTRWFSARKAPSREGWYEVMRADGGQLMGDWRKIGGESAFWTYAEFGAIPMCRKIANVKKWRGMLAGEDRSMEE